jgi:hypothetical protein
MHGSTILIRRRNGQVSFFVVQKILSRPLVCQMEGLGQIKIIKGLKEFILQAIIFDYDKITNNSKAY